MYEPKFTCCMKTALITGATSGIGRELALLLAATGHDLVLSARNEAQLLRIKDEAESQGVAVRIFPLDLSKAENAEALCRRLHEARIQIDILVNNAGFGVDGCYLDISWEKEEEMFRLNMLTVAYLTHAFAVRMKAQGFGRILNIASIAAFQPGPYMAGYCATKAFVLSLSEAVNYELKGTGVTVSALCPGVTDTAFHRVAGTEQVGMSRYLPHASAREVAQYGYKLIQERQAVGVYGFFNRMLVFANRLVPRSVSVYLSARLLKAEAEGGR